MENTRSIDRTNKGANEVIMQDVPRSGMDLSYTSHDGGIPLGRLIPITYQKLMAGAKYRLANRANLTFEQLSTPLLGNVDICQHNFFVPYRAVDKSFESLMTPTKLDGMGATSVAPSFNFNYVLNKVARFVSNIITLTNPDFPTIDLRVNLSYFNSISTLWDNVYHHDALIDLQNQLMSRIGVTSSVTPFEVTLDFSKPFESQQSFQTLVILLQDIFDFFVGKRSLLDKFGYYYVSHKQIVKFVMYIYDRARSSFTPLGTDLSLYSLLISFADFMRHEYPLQNEYAIRAYYAIWFEYYRNFDIEPRSASLPEWKSFSSSSIVTPNNNVNDLSTLHFLVPRIRSWAKDPFIAAGIDDISRHVFAPVLSNDDTIATVSNQPLTKSSEDSTLFGDLSSVGTSWRNPNTGVVQSLSITLPSSILSQLRVNDLSDSQSGISLVNLRRANMLENWLKRIYYGGDEYRDRMLSLYGARIEDYRINRPEWLSSSLDSRDVKQEVTNSGAPAGSSVDGMASIGTRTATATATQNGSDVTSNYTPEFGIYIGVLSVMPRATYDTLNYQNLELKNADFPIPQFAHSMEECILSPEISRQVLNTYPFGYAAYGHAYRGRVDEVHGDYLDEKFDFVFSRSFDDTNDSTQPRLKYGFIHCRPYLPMFVNKVLLDGQVYGTFMHDFFVENPLPTPVETI